MSSTAGSPTVSVLIPSYNAERFITTCVESVTSQTYENLEILIIDDRSTDGTFEILNELATRDSRIKLLQNETNLGALANFRRSLELAGGDYIKCVCCDDLLRPDAIMMLTAVMEQQPEVGLASSRWLLIDDDGKTLETRTLRISGITPFPLEPPICIADGYDAGNHLLAGLDNWIGAPTNPMFRNGGLPLEGLYTIGPISPPRLVDVVWWLKLIAGSRIGYVNEFLSSFRIHDDQQSKDDRLFPDLVLSWYDVIIGARAIGFLQAPEVEAAALRRAAEHIAWGAPRFPPEALPRVQHALGEIEARLRVLQREALS